MSEVTLQGEVRRIFTGWMYASSPGLHAIEHPIYDIWITDCKAPLTKVVEEPAPVVAPAQRPQQPRNPNQPRTQQQAQPQQPQQPQQQQRAPQQAPVQQRAPAPPGTLLNPR